MALPRDLANVLLHMWLGALPLVAGPARNCDPLRDGFDGAFAAVLTRPAR